MDKVNTVWNLDDVPDLPREKVLSILHRLQNRCHELHDALQLAKSFINEGCNYTDEMALIYKVAGGIHPDLERVQPDGTHR